MASAIILTVLALFAFTTIAPYFVVVPEENQQVFAQQNATLQNILLVIVAFFFGQNSGNLKKDDAIAKLAEKAPAPAVTTTSYSETTTVPAKDPQP